MTDTKKSDSPLPVKVIGGYKYSNPGPRMASISPLQKVQANAHDSELFPGGGTLGLVPSASSGLKRGALESKLSILEKVKKDKGVFKARPLASRN